MPDGTPALIRPRRVGAPSAAAGARVRLRGALVHVRARLRHGPHLVAGLALAAEAPGSIDALAVSAAGLLGGEQQALVDVDAAGAGIVLGVALVASTGEGADGVAAAAVAAQVRKVQALVHIHILYQAFA